MRLRGEYRFEASLDAVWLALNDPQLLSQCIDSRAVVRRTGAQSYAVTVKPASGAGDGGFEVTLTLLDIDPPHAATLEAAIEARGAGSGRGSARVTLTPERGGTVLRYEVEGRLDGSLEPPGQRPTAADGRRIADEFLARFHRIVAPAAAAGRSAHMRRPPTTASIVFAVLALAALLILVRGPPQTRFRD